MARIKTKLTDVYNALTGESKKPYDFKSTADVIAKISENVSGGGGGGSGAVYWGTENEEYNFTFDLTFQELKNKIDEVGTVMLGIRPNPGMTVIFQTDYIEINNDTYYSIIQGFVFLDDGQQGIKLVTSTLSGAVNDNVLLNMQDIKPFVDSEIDDSSMNPVQNKVIKSYVDGKILDVASTMSGSTVTCEITHADLQTAMDAGKVVRVKLPKSGTGSVVVYCQVLGYTADDNNGNVAYAMALNGQDGSLIGVKSQDGNPTDNVVFVLGA